MVSATVARVMTSLLNAKPKKLQNAISCLRSQPNVIAPIDGIEIQRVEAWKPEHDTSELAVSRREGLFQAVGRNLAGIISRKDDRYVALSWCILGRRLIEYENADNNLETSGIRKKYDGILKIFCSCNNQVLSTMCKGSNMQDGFELPSRLAVAAADFVVSLTVALTRNDLSSKNKHNKQKSSVVYSKNLSPTSMPSSSGERETKKWSKGSELPTDSKSKLMLWNNLDALITLVKKLTAWSRKSRSLHANGSERVLKWLQGIQEQYGCCQNEAGVVDIESLKL